MQIESISRRHRPNAAAVVALIALGAAAPVSAQSSGKGFLFHRPVGSFSIRGGYAFANAGSDVFADATSNLTLSKRDFSSIDWGGDISYSFNNKTDLVFDGEFSTTHPSSEFRNFIDNNDQPIQQSTKFKRVPLSVGLKYYFAGRGRTVSQFAYIPNRYSPYVGVGVGAMYYSFQQNGDFVDFKTLDVFPATLESSGWTPTGHGSAGMEYSLGNWVALTGEGRYVWAKARLDPNDFEGYQKIDLTGFTGTVGFRVRF
jgi:outer membrane protein W